MSNDGDLRRRALDRLRGRRRPVGELSPRDVEELVHELEVQQAELEVQNEELRRVERRLAEARDRYLELYEFAPVGYLTLDAGASIAEVNLAAAALAGRPREELVGHRFERMVARSHQDVAFTYLRALATGEEPAPVELLLDRADGVQMWVLLRASFASERHGYLAVLSDVTENRRLTAELGEREERLRMALDAGHMGLWDRDLDTEVTVWSRRLYELVGRDPNDAVDDETFFEYIHPDDLDSVRGHVELWLERGGDLEEELRVVREDGEVRWLAVLGRIRPDAQGAQRRLIGVNFDITARKQTEEELHRSYEQLETRVSERTRELEMANAELRRRTTQLRRLAVQLTLVERQERAQLAAILHDELQQMLVGARFQLETLVRRGLPPETPERLGAVSTLLADAVDRARGLSHELNPPLEHQGFGAALHWLTGDLRARCGFEVEVAGEGVEPESEAVRDILFRAVKELLLNALKHAGVRHARVSLVATDAELQVEVVDRGCGFDASEERKSGGIGLPSVHERLEVIGGRLEVQSVRGEGTRARVAVPIEPSAELRPHRRRSDRMPPPALAPPQRIRVLVADDHRMVREGIAELLGAENDIEVVAQAADGQQVLDLAAATFPDVVVMDLRMPRLDGFDTTRALAVAMPHVRVIAVSMHEPSEVGVAARDAGAVAFLSKQGPTEALIVAVRAARSDS